MEITHCLLMLFSLEYAAGNNMLISSNVTTASVFETYRINCSTVYKTIAFYKNGVNFTTTSREAVDKPCKTSTNIKCKIKKQGRKYSHEIFIKVHEQDKANITWQCKHVTNQNTKSDIIHVHININERMEAVTNTEMNSESTPSDNTVLFIIVAIVVSSLLVLITLIAAFIIVKKRKQPISYREVETRQIETRGEVIIDENVMYSSGETYYPPTQNTSTDYDTVVDNPVTRGQESTRKNDDDSCNLYAEVDKETKPKEVELPETNDTDSNVYAEVNKKCKN